MVANIYSLFSIYTKHFTNLSFNFYSLTEVEILSLFPFVKSCEMGVETSDNLSKVRVLTVKDLRFDSKHLSNATVF